MQASTTQRTGVTAIKSGAKSLRRAITAQEKAHAKKAPMVHARLAALRAAIRSLSMSCAEASTILGGTTHLELAELSTTEHIDLQVAAFVDAHRVAAARRERSRLRCGCFADMGYKVLKETRSTSDTAMPLRSS